MYVLLTFHSNELNKPPKTCFENFGNFEKLRNLHCVYVCVLGDLKKAKTCIYIET